MSFTVELDEQTVAALKELAAVSNRSAAEIIQEAVVDYVRHKRPLPKGLGQYHSGRSDGAEKARDLLRDAVKERQWP